MEIDSLSADKARTQWSRLLDHVAFDDEHVVITRHGRPVAVIVPLDWYEQAVGEFGRERPVPYPERRQS